MKKKTQNNPYATLRQGTVKAPVNTAASDPKSQVVRSERDMRDKAGK